MTTTAKPRLGEEQWPLRRERSQARAGHLSPSSGQNGQTDPRDRKRMALTAAKQKNRPKGRNLPPQRAHNARQKPCPPRSKSAAHGRAGGQGVEPPGPKPRSGPEAAPPTAAARRPPHRDREAGGKKPTARPNGGQGPNAQGPSPADEGRGQKPGLAGGKQGRPGPSSGAVRRTGAA